MRLYEPGELDKALKKIGITIPDAARCKAAEIEEAAQMFLMRRQAETSSPPSKVISELKKIFKLADDLHTALLEGKDPKHKLAESDVERATARSLRTAIMGTDGNRGSLGNKPFKTFRMEELDEELANWPVDRAGEPREIKDWPVDRAFYHSLRAVEWIRDRANSALSRERNRKALGKMRPTHQADDALSELLYRLIEISEYGPRTSEPSAEARAQGKAEKFGPLIKYLELCLEPLKDHDLKVKKLKPGGLRNRVRRLETKSDGIDSSQHEAWRILKEEGNSADLPLVQPTFDPIQPGAKFYLKWPDREDLDGRLFLCDRLELRLFNSGKTSIAVIFDLDGREMRVEAAYCWTHEQFEEAAPAPRKE